MAVSYDLFAQSGDKSREAQAPLAWKLRPRTLDDVIGHEHLTGPQGLLRSLVASSLRSVIFHGPAGTGKTTLARILADQTHAAFAALSAIDIGVKEIRQEAERAKERWQLRGSGTVVFIDEIHRLNRSQQDVLLPFVEDGTFVLIGATTENPWVSINRALLSRCLLIELKTLKVEAIVQILERAWALRMTWWHEGAIDDGLFHQIAERVGGDARLALSTLEHMALLADTVPTNVLTIALGDRVLASSVHYHDRAGDAHYDLTSAFIKSMRGSDPDAALYWFGRLLAGGTDPRYVMRRILVHAAEDVGLADPMALVVAQAAWTALEAVGLPEARIPMAQAVLYIASAPKSNSVVTALAELDSALERWPQAAVPSYLRDKHYAPMGASAPLYQYPHDFPMHYVDQAYLPDEMAGLRLYHPSDQGSERVRAQKLAALRQGRHNI
ncbi:replication-associated recombination protein A [Sulfobacillus sp. hq2]|uniref:replication-associated recombination protein A n=1 Tax=Sulfobacillus sp. hq2 TaxID=2039167 RepID=UPI00156FB3E8|nr:replication-associated recombination protein A [Sulfobacillus sp. hq2]